VTRPTVTGFMSCMRHWMSSTTIAGRHDGHNRRSTLIMGVIMILIIRSAKESPGTTVLVARTGSASEPRNTTLRGNLYRWMTHRSKASEKEA
jgi:hypothetical protein